MNLDSNVIIKFVSKPTLVADSSCLSYNDEE